jgi:hypothetical protein
LKINVYTASVVLLVVFGVLTGISVAIKTVDVSTLPVEIQGVWQGIVYVFSTSSVAPLFVFVRNIYGFYVNKYQLKPEQRTNLEYEANKLVATWLVYEGYIKAFTVMVMAFTQGTPLEPYAVYIAGSSAFIVDLIRKSLFDIAKTPITTSSP